MTPKTLDKYIASLKKKATAGGWSQAEYELELDKIQDEMTGQFTDGKITQAEYEKVVKQISNAFKSMTLQGKAPAAQTAKKAMTLDEMLALKQELKKKYMSGILTLDEWDKQAYQVTQAYKNSKTLEETKAALASPVAQTPQGMSHDEYIGMWEALNKKKKAGLITPAEYSALGAKLDKAYNDKKTASEIEKEIGCDPGTLATDQAVIDLGKEFKKVYAQASKEMQAQLDEYMKKFGPEMKDLEMKFIDGTITPEEYEHLKLMTLQKNILGQKADQLEGVMLNANQKAMKMINGEMLNVFAENANWQSYQLTQDTKMNLMFSVYDEHTVQKLVKDKPELLPRKEVNGVKDKAWNQKIIAGAIAQGVIQGDSIPKLAKRIAVQTGETNMKAMVRYARTAMTSAQNSGRQEMLQRAKGMGIKCKKVWLATLDSRTRDAHAKMDGQAVDIDDDFQSDFGPIKYPGDVGSKGSVPANLYNCRCTLIYDYEGFPNDPTADQRMSYDEYYTEETDADGKKHKVFHRDGKLITDMTYDEWATAKKGSMLNDLNTAKMQLAEAQKEFVKEKVKPDKVYEGIWKDPVTLADYPAKKDAIQAKRDYYDSEIQKYKDAQAAGASWATYEKIKDLQKKLKLLNEFEKNGQILEKRDAALKAVQAVYDQVGYQKSASAPDIAKTASKTSKKAAAASGVANTGSAGQTGAGLSLDSAGGKKTPFGPDAYSQERKDKALWSDDKRYVDSLMRGPTGEAWNKGTKKEHEAIVEYTSSYSKFNEPLRGIEYGTSRYLGVGKTDLGAGYKKNGPALNAMTDMIDKCSYPHDMWLQRGCGYNGMDKFFQCSPELLRNGSQKELEQALLGTTPTEYGFMSMGSAKGQGFSGNILMNIYAPSGTKMMYAEPFSHYGGHDYNWDGKSKQSHFGGEFETIMQQGTQFRVTKVERRGRSGTIYVDLEVINQDNQQRWKP